MALAVGGVYALDAVRGDTLWRKKHENVFTVPSLLKAKAYLIIAPVGEARR